jgi:hypothetical protein
MKRVIIYNFNAVSRLGGFYSCKQSDIPNLYLYATSNFTSINELAEDRQEIAMIWFLTKPLDDNKADEFLHWMDINLIHQGNQSHVSKLFAKIKSCFKSTDIEISNLDIVYNDCLCPGISMEQDLNDRHEYCNRPIFKDLLDQFQGEYILWQIYNLQGQIFDAKDPRYYPDEVLGDIALRGYGNHPDCRLSPEVITHCPIGTSYGHTKGLRETNDIHYCPPTINSPGVFSAKLFKHKWVGMPDEWLPVKWQVPTIDDYLDKESFRRKYNCVPLMIKL